MPLNPIDHLRRQRIEGWRAEAVRTNLWVVPTALSILTILLFAVTVTADRIATDGRLALPSWVDSGSPDAARQILTAIAAAIITVVGLVFSITIVALTLASTQFGPRMLRNFIRSFGTQFTLGVFVATFLYSILALVSISQHNGQEFVPHISITVDFALVVADLVVLIYFIHDVATSIQLNHVIAGIAADLIRTIDGEAAVDSSNGRRPIVHVGPSVDELTSWLDEHGAAVVAVKSGFLQVIEHKRLKSAAENAHAVVGLLYRPGHFVVQGRALALVWPPEAAGAIARALERAHFVGPARTRSQDVVLGIDQLVEIAIRALSPAVNDTFTALACIDWLGAALCRITTTSERDHIHRDAKGARAADPTRPALRQVGQRGVRQGASGGPGHARGHHSAAAGPDGNSGLYEERRAATGTRQAGSDAAAIQRGEYSRGERPRGRSSSV